MLVWKYINLLNLIKKEERFLKYKNIYKSFEDYFHEQLFVNLNKDSLNYLLKRKISLEVIKKFKIGFVPKNNNFFEILKKTFSEDEIKLSGLFYLIESSNNYINRFNSRIIFPIKNLSGDTIAFGGRVIQNTKLAKYINSPETEFYKKGRQLFNINNAKDERIKENEVIIVEGYADVLSLYSNGIKNVISNSGTALTELQIKLIWKFFSNPIICLDGDESGQLAALRIAERLFSTITENNKIYFTILENGKDPDDIVKEKKEGFLKLLENKVVIQKFLWNKYIEKININNPYEVAKFEKSIRKLCNQIQDKTLKKYILEDYLIKISKLTPHVNLNNKFKFSKNQNFKVLNETKKIHMQKKSFSRLDLLEMSILFIMLNYKNVVKSKIKKLIETNFETIENNNLKLNLINLYDTNNTNKEIENSILEDNKKSHREN